MTETPETPDSLALDQRHGPGVYPARGITLVRGEGARVYDDRGRSYIDCVGGHGAAVLGHAHPALTKAIAEQASRLISCSGSFANDTRSRTLSFLSDVTGFERFFLANSGTEAVEGAIKIARLVTKRRRIVAFKQGFHGRTLGALTATWDPEVPSSVRATRPRVRARRLQRRRSRDERDRRSDRRGLGRGGSRRRRCASGDTRFHDRLAETLRQGGRLVGPRRDSDGLRSNGGSGSLTTTSLSTIDRSDRIS